jgi:hypothetical protein
MQKADGKNAKKAEGKKKKSRPQGMSSEKWLLL